MAPFSGILARCSRATALCIVAARLHLQVLSNDDKRWVIAMLVRTVRDLGGLVRNARRQNGLTQAGLAKRIGVGRDWVSRLEQGHPRLEAHLVLDALDAAGV